MIKHTKEKAPSPVLQKQAKIKLLPYQNSKIIALPEQNASKKEKQMPLFYNKPIYKGKKHELF